MGKCCWCSQCSHQLCLLWKRQGVGLLWTFCGVPALSTGCSGMIHCGSARTSIIITGGAMGTLLFSTAFWDSLRWKLMSAQMCCVLGTKIFCTCVLFSNNRRSPRIKKLFQLRKAVKRWDCLQLGPCLSISKGKEIIIFSNSLRQQ